MASTTSAAASILQSPTLTSQLPTTTSSSPIFNSYSPTANANNLHALNFSPYSSHIPSPHQYFSFPNSSISTSNSRPTITLDLTAPPPPPPTNFGKLASSKPLSFSSNFHPLQSSIPQPPPLAVAPWNSTYNGNYFNYGTLTHNGNQSGSLLNSGKQPFQGHIIHQPNHLKPFPGAIAAAATKAVTSNSKFQSALAAALTTYLNNGGVGGGGGDMYHQGT